MVTSHIAHISKGPQTCLPPPPPYNYSFDYSGEEEHSSQAVQTAIPLLALMMVFGFACCAVFRPAECGDFNKDLKRECCGCCAKVFLLLLLCIHTLTSVASSFMDESAIVSDWAGCDGCVPSQCLASCLIVWAALHALFSKLMRTCAIPMVLRINRCLLYT